MDFYYDTDINDIIEITENFHNGFIKCSDPLRLEIDPLKLLEQVSNVLNYFDKYTIDGISLTGQMHGFVALDKNHKPVTNFFTWMDKVALHKNSNGVTYLDEFLHLLDYEPKNSMIGYMAPNLYTIKKMGTLPKNAYYFVTIHDFITYELCKRAVIDPSFAKAQDFIVVTKTIGMKIL